MRPLTFAVALLFLNPLEVAAAVVVLANATDQPVRFTLAHPGRQAAEVELAAGEVRPVPCGRKVNLTFTAGGKPTELRLDAYDAYIFIPENGKTELRGIGLTGKRVPLDDVPEELPVAPPPLKVTVKLLADDADRRTQKAWEPALRKRLEAAAEVVAAHGPVRFEVVDAKGWASKPDAADLSVQYADFQDVVRPAPARLAVGFTSRRYGEVPGDAPFAIAKTVLQPHILIRESEPRTEAERVEVLVQQLGKYLGAVASPDPNSAMRTKLGDGKAVYAKFRVGFDPLNTLAMNIWVEELRAGRGPKASDLRPAARVRLGRVYATLADALPEVPIPDEYVGLVAVANGIPQNAPAAAAPARPEPAKDPRAAKRLSAKQEAVRRVVRVVVQRAAQNERRAPDEKLDGDDLTAYYVKAAADAARLEDGPVRSAAFLIGLGIALDDSTVLRTNPLTADFCKAAETDDERKERLAVLGRPTVRDWRDLCQHFVVSAALTEFVGATLAEQAGLAKELLDMKGTSGFSFTDLCADIAGVEFAALVRKKPDLLDQWRLEFNVEDHMPKIEGLKDGLSADQFRNGFGDVSDERFLRALDDIRKRVRALPGRAGRDR